MLYNLVRGPQVCQLFSCYVSPSINKVLTYLLIKQAIMEITDNLKASIASILYLVAFFRLLKSISYRKLSNIARQTQIIWYPW